MAQGFPINQPPDEGTWGFYYSPSHSITIDSITTSLARNPNSFETNEIRLQIFSVSEPFEKVVVPLRTAIINQEIYYWGDSWPEAWTEVTFTIVPLQLSSDNNYVFVFDKPQETYECGTYCEGIWVKQEITNDWSRTVIQYKNWNYQGSKIVSVYDTHPSDIRLNESSSPDSDIQICKYDSITATAPASRFTDNGDGTVTDKATGLQWKRCSEGQSWDQGACLGTATTHTWQEALQLSAGASYAGLHHWRVPNLKELASIGELACTNPAIDLAVFPNTGDANRIDWSLAQYGFQSVRCVMRPAASKGG